MGAGVSTVQRDVAGGEAVRHGGGGAAGQAVEEGRGRLGRAGAGAITATAAVV